jgi:hypothetical protein
VPSANGLWELFVCESVGVFAREKIFLGVNLSVVVVVGVGMAFDCSGAIVSGALFGHWWFEVVLWFW